MDILSTYATDEVLEVKGKWFTLAKDAKVLVARTGNENYAKLLRSHMELNPLEGLSSQQQEEVGSEILLDVMAKTILVGWTGLQYQGKPVEYSVEMAKTFLKVKDFRKKISSLADNFEAYRAKAEVEQGNDSATT